MAGKVTFGFCFTFTTCWNVELPQALLIVSVTVYVPGPVNVNEGFAEFALVPFANVHAALVPQNDGV